jgi:outer membrane protein OmpA-like peptidoglycan-associated protein
MNFSLYSFLIVFGFLLIKNPFSVFENVHKPTFYSIEGWVLNEENNEPIVNATVLFRNIEKSLTIKAITNEKGYFNTLLDAEEVFDAIISHPQYFTQASIEINTTMRNKIFQYTFKLKEVVVGKGVRIEGIEFDPNTNIPTQESEVTLEKLHKLMDENPHLVFEIGVHTDSRGNDEYNLALSQGRADEIAFNLIRKGIPKNRLSAKGYGETRLVNHCANGVRCNSEEHQLNRRIEFIVRDILSEKK